MKVAFVTGANKGIGLAIIKKLSKAFGDSNEWHIYLTARNEGLGRKCSDDLKKQGYNVRFHQLDITDVHSREEFLNFIKSTYPDGINIAINNAGIIFEDDLTASSIDHVLATINTNFTSTLDFTLEFIPLLAKNARVVLVSSRFAHMTLKRLSDALYEKVMSKMDLNELRLLVADYLHHIALGDQEKSGWPSTAYGVSKIALTKASYILGETIANDPRHIVLNACCPGYVATDLNDHKGTSSVEEGADTPFYLATLPVGVAEPINKFVAERQVIQWSKDAPLNLNI